MPDYTNVLKPGEDNTEFAPGDKPVKMVCIQNRKPGLTFEEFDRYWREDHAKLVAEVAEVMGFTRYVQTPAYKSSDIEAFKTKRGWTGTCDGLTEVWFASEAHMKAALSSEAAQAANKRLMADEANFIADSVICFISFERDIF
ncbi:hypothetical protein CALVIDRAFT_603412 [Calocera viscosa TUFC12733]|uniref:EthD domain-containing protein n=1 Tax=Calocera viscosa (strain TUFC12733) TaxID=1330018 RepID=A0A167FS45_CALVF|nr:hypothetical protein CALVIDRAFT_603412 [Calocera viscosa TUFC12733]